MVFSIRSLAIGLAAVVLGTTVEAGTAPAQAQFHPGYAYRPYAWRGPVRAGPVFGNRPAFGYRPAYRWGYRGGPRYAYRPAYWGPGYRAGYYGYGYRPYFRPYDYRPYRYYGYYRPYGYYGYGYGPNGYYRPYDDDGGAVVAGLIGGLALGTIINAQRHAYRPAYYRPGQRCFYERRRIVDRYGHVVYRRVRACR